MILTALPILLDTTVNAGDGGMVVVLAFLVAIAIGIYALFKSHGE